MDRFKSTLRTRLYAIAVFDAVALILYAMGFMYSDRIGAPGASDFMRSMVTGFQIGALAGIQIMLIPVIVRYSKALRDEAALKRLHIDETDERKRFIKMRIGGVGLNIALGGLAVAVIVAGYVNEVAFLTLLGATTFVAFTKGALKLYYHNKY